jgi:uncharacterized RDD family membrane protein YckC
MPTPPLEPGRSRILAAAAIDAALLVGIHAGALALATAWLLARTSAGRGDVGEGDAVVAVAIAGAAAPAWVAWTLLITHRRRGTPGQRVTGIRPVPDWGVPQWSLYVRAMASPLSLPGWLWMAATPLLAGMPAWLALPAMLAAAAVLASGIGSLAIALLRPSARMLHDRVARTTLVMVEP